MNSRLKPTGTRSRGLILTEQALKLLDQALRQWWEKSAARQASTTGKLSREKKAEGLDLTVNTVDRLYRREPVDEGTLRHAFNALNITPPFSKERHCVSASTPSGKLPYWSTPCIGRETEVAEIKALLEANPLVTLTGTGGVGKTRLAIQVAEEMKSDFAAGIWLVELAGVTDPALVPQEVASLLGVQEEKERPLLQKLSDFLRGKPLLLILDNCEHLPGACAILAHHLLSSSPSSSALRVLATSRERLNIPFERPFYVPSLSVPDMKKLSGKKDNTKDNTKDITKLLWDYASVRLFVESASKLRPDFTLTDQNAHRVVSICQRLDGIPLALELAAARVRAMPLDTLERELQDCFRILIGGNRAALPRHQTLRATIDWSYDPLAEKEKVLLQRLAVFADGCRLDTAEQVCAGSGIEAGEILDLLTSLVDKSLVVYQEREGKGRYHLLEVIRQYGRDRLAESGESDAIREQHRDYFLALAEEAEAHLTGAEQGEWLERLETEHASLNAALDRSLSEAGQAVSLRFCTALQRFWHTRGYLSEGLSWCVRVLAAVNTEAKTLERAKTLNVAGNLARLQGDFVPARELFEESLVMSQQSGDTRGIALSLNGLGGVAYDQGDYESARKLFEESLKISRQSGDKRGIALSLRTLGLVDRTLVNLGLVDSGQGNYDVALARYEESLTIFRELRDKKSIAEVLCGMGELFRNRSDYDAAIAHYEQSLAISREIGDKQVIASSLYGLGEIRNKHDLVLAGELYEESLAIRQELGDKKAIAESMEAFARLAATEGRSMRAARLWGAAEVLRAVIGMPLPPHERPRFERHMTVAHEAVGEEMYVVAWAQGRSMTLEQTIKYALANTGD